MTSVYETGSTSLHSTFAHRAIFRGSLLIPSTSCPIAIGNGSSRLYRSNQLMFKAFVNSVERGMGKRPISPGS
jgi:hypothetical protein